MYVKINNYTLYTTFSTLLHTFFEKKMRWVDL